MSEWPFDKNKVNLGASPMTFASQRLLYLNAPLNEQRRSKDLVSLPHLVRFGNVSFQNCCPRSTSHIFTSTFPAGWGIPGLKPCSATAPKALGSPGHGLYLQDREQRCPNPKKQVVMPTIIPVGFWRQRRHPAFLVHNTPKVTNTIIAQTQCNTGIQNPPT